MVVQEVPTRRYPSQGLAAHLIGYVGEASDQQVSDDGLSSGAIVGQSGVERVYNRMLMGGDGARRVVVNSVGREIRELEKVPPTEGTRVQLSINYAMQRAAENAFHAYGYWGAAVVLDPRSGDVLTLTSLPAYDPNDFAAGIDRATWASLNTDKLRPLQNRAIQGRYSPGSTFKIVVATAALEDGLVTPDYKVFCPGGATFYGRYFKCHLAGGHGTVDMRHAIEKSCNVYFYTLGNMLGIDQDPRVRGEARARRQERCRPAQRDREHRALHRVEEAADRGEVVRRRDDLGFHRAGAAVGDADVDGGDDGDGCQRRHARGAAFGDGDRRRRGMDSRCRRRPLHSSRC